MIEDDDELEVTKPDGQTASPSEILRAIEEVARAKDHEMSCPVLDCSGKIEAQAKFWMGITPDGRPFLDAIGWMETGYLDCSIGGRDHVPDSLTEQLDATLLAYCANAENMLGASKGEDAMPRAAG